MFVIVDMVEGRYVSRIEGKEVVWGNAWDDEALEYTIILEDDKGYTNNPPLVFTNLAKAQETIESISPHLQELAIAQFEDERKYFKEEEFLEYCKRSFDLMVLCATKRTVMQLNAPEDES